MKNDFVFLSDEELSSVTGGLQINLVTNGNTVSMPTGLVDIGFQTGNFVGLLNGTAPHLGDGSPVSGQIIP